MILLSVLILSIVSIGSIRYINSALKAENRSLDVSLDQQQIIDNITSILIRKGVPISSVKIITEPEANPPILVSFTVLSSSTNDQLAPLDPIYINIIGHEVNFAQLHGLNTGGVSVIIVNSQGAVLLRDKKPVLNKAYLSTVVSKPSNTDADNLTAAFSNTPTFGMALENVNIYPVESGAFQAKFKVNASNAALANTSIPNFLRTLLSRVTELNNSGARIGIYEVEITDSAGNKLLQYINDLEVGSRQNWWQSEALTEVWYPHPN